MINIRPGEEYYAICNRVERGIFDNQRFIYVGDGEPICVRADYLRITPDNFVAAKFYVDEINKGIASGIVYGMPPSLREVPLDSLSSREEVVSMEGQK